MSMLCGSCFGSGYVATSTGDRDYCACAAGQQQRAKDRQFMWLLIGIIAGVVIYLGRIVL